MHPEIKEVVELLEKVKRPVENEFCPEWWIQKNILCYLDQPWM